MNLTLNSDELALTMAYVVKCNISIGGNPREIYISKKSLEQRRIACKTLFNLGDN
jgi:long-subunit fatty acid transport protein